MGEPLLDSAGQALRERLGRDPVWAARAPGRVNLIGEHTDYNQGLVLPCAIDRSTVVVAAPRNDRRLRIHSTSLGVTGEVALDALRRERSWLDYVQGVVAAFDHEGILVPGLDVAVAADLPRDSGLSSSASFEVALATLFAAASGRALAPEALARLAHRAESGFVGVPCGRMDQLASALGRRDHALRIDCLDFRTRPVRLPEVALLIVGSGVRRQLADGAYGERRAECEAGLERARGAGVAPETASSWRDVPVERLPELERVLPAPWRGRARHVLTESQRVDATCCALEAGDLAGAGALLREGMRSLRDDFEASCPELDSLCEIADAEPGCYGSRLTGAGFGGCTIHLVDPARVDAVGDAIRQGFASRFGREPPLLRVRASQGAELL